MRAQKLQMQMPLATVHVIEVMCFGVGHGGGELFIMNDVGILAVATSIITARGTRGGGGGGMVPNRHPYDYCLGVVKGRWVREGGEHDGIIRGRDVRAVFRGCVGGVVGWVEVAVGVAVVVEGVGGHGRGD